MRAPTPPPSALLLTLLVAAAPALAQAPAPPPGPDAAPPADATAEADVEPTGDAAASGEAGEVAGPEADHAAADEAPEPAPEEEAAAAVAEAAEGAPSVELAQGLREWKAALERKPDIVSLGTLGDLAQARDQLAKMLEQRLKLLGRKKISNRQWRDYWGAQADVASRLADLYEEQGSDGASAKAKGLREWAALARDKVTNQDRYLDAIETERDAIEERHEALLMLETSAEAAAGGGEDTPPILGTPGEQPTPYEVRESRLREIRRSVAHQEARRSESRVELDLVQRQLETQDIMEDALAKDVDLAEREHRIAAEQAASGDASWGAIWQPLAERSRDKVDVLAEELRLGEQRRRDMEVEVSLLESQIDFRAEKKAELEAKLEEVGSFEGLLAVVWETTVQWVKTQGWKVALMLLLIWLGLRLALRLVYAGTRAILLAVEDDDPDTVSAEEARAHTIAAVFKGVARIALYAIAALLAMDQVGINTGPILGSVAILGLAVSFGSQNLVKDVVNGFFILLENQYAVGNVVEVSGVAGVVEEVNVRSTRIRTLNGTLHVIPNGQISQVANMTRDWSRLLVHVGVAYATDIDRCIGIIDRVGREMAEDPAWADAILEAPTCLGVTELGDSSIVLRVMGQVQPGEQWGAEREFNRRIKLAFDAEGIEIPFPQRVIWHRREDEEDTGSLPTGPARSKAGGGATPSRRPTPTESASDEAKEERMPTKMPANE